MPRRTPLLVFLAGGLCAGGVTASLAAQASAPSWPHWRGPARDGVSRETVWAHAGATEPKWTAEVGLGHSSVVIAKGCLFTLGFDKATQTDWLRCLDPQTGKEQWKRSWPGKLYDRSHDGGTLTTPSIDGDTLFVSTRDGQCFAFRTADGTPLWQQNYAASEKLQAPTFRFSASPLVMADRLIVVLGNTVLAVNKDRGAVLWRTDGMGFVGYANPVPFTLRGQRKVAVFGGLGLIVLDLQTGKEEYRYPWAPKGGGVNVCTPIVFGDKIFISSSYNMGAALLRLGAGSTPELVWKTRRMRNKCSGCVLLDGHIYGFDEAVLKCFDLQGQEKWRVRGLGFGSVSVAGRRLMILSERGELIIGTADPDRFAELSRRQLFEDGRFWTPPVLVQGLIYCRSSLGKLVCLDHTARAAPPAPTPAQAVVEPPTGTPPNPAALFAQHARWIGAEKLLQRRSAQFTGTLAMPDTGTATQSVTVHVTPTGRSLTGAMSLGGMPHRGFDAQRSWEAAPVFRTRILPAAVHRAMRETRGLHAFCKPLSDARKLGPPTAVVFAGQSCWRVSVPNGSAQGVRLIYFQAESGRLFGHGAPEEPTFIYAAWKNFDGVQLPTQTRIVDPETGDESLVTVTSVQWDRATPPHHGAPARVLRLLRKPTDVVAATQAVARSNAKQLGTYAKKIGAQTAELKVTANDGALLLTCGLVPPMWFGPADDNGVHRERDGLPITLRFQTAKGHAVATLRFQGVDHVFARQD